MTAGLFMPQVVLRKPRSEVPEKTKQLGDAKDPGISVTTMLSTLPFQVSLFSVIRVHDAGGNVVETHDQTGRGQTVVSFALFCHRITDVVRLEAAWA
jgi:hypothetical protein